MLRIRLPYGDVVSSSRSRGNAKHQIYIEGVGFIPYSATGPVPRYPRLAARRYEPNTCPVRSRVDRVLGRRRAWPVEVAPAGTENEIDDPNPTVNTTIRGGSTTATRRLSAAAKGPGEAVTSSYAV